MEERKVEGVWAPSFLGPMEGLSVWSSVWSNMFRLHYPPHPPRTVQAQALVIQRLHWVGARKTWPFCCRHVPRPLCPTTHDPQGGRDEGVRDG